MKYLEEKGDLFDLSNDFVLAHCISRDVTATTRMNAGIAKVFRSKWPLMAKEIQPISYVGQARRYRSGKRVIYNLISKGKYSDKVYNDPDLYYTNLKSALEDLRRQMVLEGEHDLGIPQIACGLDGGELETVRLIVKEVFSGADVDIIMRILPSEWDDKIHGDYVDESEHQ
jgi:hypothetical protein